MADIKIGNLPIDKAYFGNNEISAIYFGNVKVYESGPAVVPYLTFSSPNSFTLKVNNSQKYWDGTLEYSTDLSTWNTWAGTTILSSASDGTNYNLYLRGTGNTYITGPNTTYSQGYWVLTGSNISCIGNIENLLDYATVANRQHPVMGTSCYTYMFQNCTSLITAPELPAITLEQNCYSNMFNGCTSLTTPPVLPATTLAKTCYDYMFRGCSALTTAPSLPATTLAQNCYVYMFQNCTALTTLPELPATTLVQNCYYGMFNGCSNIKVSATQTGDYQTPYRIPTTGTGTFASNALTDMFFSTGGTFKSTPSTNTTYYTSNTVIPAGGNQ